MSLFLLIYTFLTAQRILQVPNFDIGFVRVVRRCEKSLFKQGTIKGVIDDLVQLN